MLIAVANMLLFGCEPIRQGPATWHEVIYDCVVMQQLDFSCGIASLATLMQCEFGDPSVTEKTLLAQLFELVPETERQHTYEKGVSLLHLRSLAIGRDYRARVRQLKPDHLAQLDRPIIVHITVDGTYGHFAVLREVTTDGWVHLSDPSRGVVWMTVDRFMHEWKDTCTVDGESGRCVLFIYRSGYEPYQESFKKTSQNWYRIREKAARSLLFR
jgi:uncharacterized protein